MIDASPETVPARPWGWPRQWAARVLEELGGRRDWRSLRAALRQVPREQPRIGVVRPIVVAHLRIVFARSTPQP